MRTIEIQGSAQITFYQTIEVTDEEFEILQEDRWGLEVDRIIDSKFDPRYINEIKDFFIDSIEEIND